MVLSGKSALKLSQCNMEVNPPAEHPERMAYHKVLLLIKKTSDINGNNGSNKGIIDHTFSALLIPFANKSSMTARNILAPLK